MDRRAASGNAFSSEYLGFLRERNEPDGPWVGEGAGPFVIREIEGGFGLFRPWQSAEAGDEPLAELETLEDARIVRAALAVLGRPRFYQLREADGPEGPARGHVVEREGRVIGRIRPYSPEWVFACHALACVAQSPEHLATLLDVAGSSTQEEVGEILGRTAKGAAP